MATKNGVRIVQGENATFDIKLRDCDGDPFDISGFDLYKVCLTNADNSILEVSETVNANGSVVTAPAGLATILRVAVNSADTAGLKIGDRLPVGVVLDNSGTPNPRARKFENALVVEASPC